MRGVITLGSSLLFMILLATPAIGSPGHLWVPYTDFGQIRVDAGGGDQAVGYNNGLDGYEPIRIVGRVSGLRVTTPLFGWTIQVPVPSDIDLGQPLKCFAHISHNGLAEPRTFRWSGTLQQHETGDILASTPISTTTFGNAGVNGVDREVVLAPQAPTSDGDGEYVRTGPLGWIAADLDANAEFWLITFFPTLENAGFPPGNPAWLFPGSTEWIYVLGMECEYAVAP